MSIIQPVKAAKPGRLRLWRETDDGVHYLAEMSSIMEKVGCIVFMFCILLLFYL